MDSKYKTVAYHHKLFAVLLLFSWILTGCCLLFQYRREVHFKAEQLNGRLQLFNLELIHALQNGATAGSFLSADKLPLPGMRISVIDRDGNVAFDNSLDTLPKSNHLTRPEIAEAIARGSGYTVRRHSQSDNENYFYSAMAADDIIVRAAVPYSSVTLGELLAADRHFIWFMLGITITLSVPAYFVTRKLGQTISRLNRFAQKAERGERIYADEAFPHDELGEISSHIIRLYAKMQNAVTESDRQHQLALHQEQEKIRIKKQLTNNINHELKTPVASIQVCLETVMSNPDMTDSQRNHFISKCYENAGRLKRLLDDVSTITRMDDGNHHIMMEQLNVKDILDEVIADEELPAQASGIKIDCDIPATAVISGNHEMIASVFRNLTNNAISYSGGTRIAIRLTGETETEFHFEFSDNGSGVGEEHLPHLFERFYRIDKGRSRKLGGTGLGLSIVKNAIILHGGSITVSNRPEGGLQFDFTLPKESTDIQKPVRGFKTATISPLR